MTQTAPLRDLAQKLFQAAVAAADPAQALRKALQQAPLPRPEGTLYLVAIGKAAPAMMAEALTQVSGPHDALVVTHHENTASVSGATVLRAGHPVPDDAGLQAGQQVARLLDKATDKDAVVALISGGGSALVPAPVSGVTPEDKAAVNRLLLGAGLDITQMNLVRQPLSQLKGGGFLRRAAPAPVTGYLLSDVIGDDLRVIASGPTVGPIGTPQDAIALLQKHDLWQAMPPAAAKALLDAAGAADQPPLPMVTNHLIGSNRQSLQAMAAACPDWAPEIVSDRLEGDVAQAARFVLEQLQPPTGPKVWLFGGETTVVLKGDGLGGRNQELALRVALGAADRDRATGGAAGFESAYDWVFLSGGTDGRDGPTEAAGGIVDAGTAARIRAAAGDPAALLANNDSNAALALAGDLLVSAATGTNVADVQALIAVPRVG